MSDTLRVTFSELAANGVEVRESDPGIAETDRKYTVEVDIPVFSAAHRHPAETEAILRGIKAARNEPKSS